MGVARPPNQNKTSSGDLSLPPPVLLSKALQTVPSLNEHHPASQEGAPVVLGNAGKRLRSGSERNVPGAASPRRAADVLQPLGAWARLGWVLPPLRPAREKKPQHSERKTLHARAKPELSLL